MAPPKPGIIPLRPLGLGEILDGAFLACRKNAAATFGSAVLVQVVLSILTVALLGGLLLNPEQLENLNTANDSEALGWVASIMGGASVLSLVNAIAVLVLQGVLVIPVARAILNLKTGFSAMWRIAGKKIVALIGLGLVMVVAATIILAVFVLLMVVTVIALEEQSIAIVIISVLALFALAVWVTVKLALAPAALILDGTGIFASLGRSWTLVKGNWWRTFGILLLTTVIVQVIASVISTPISMVASLAFSMNGGSESGREAAFAQSVPVLLVTSLITAVFAAIGLAFQAAVTSLLYVDLRIRREGFDITLMKEHESAAEGGPGLLPGHSVRRDGRPHTPPAGQSSGPWPQ
ncbi:hypothetical protein [Arthrobacter roseus]|uniref:hypothetical protein n=1 Tax=Arthrobacter roseus TaxID=136274 RepID=UPI0019634759|nr:hypothetical protein [Arthrobacter roseus]MBM7849115.1 hypothetical protein [Arthrobacter roseus]